ncbi:MAG TPA: hypothetical protein VIM31_00755 [Candidatus Microsaccharimonas sp.]|jgi:hypothetical protein
MDNNQFQKNVYQVPASPSGESLDASVVIVDTEMPQTEVEQKFLAIEREYVRDTFNQMTQDLEMSLSGYDDRTLPVLEVTPHPTALELKQIADELQERRARHLASLIKRVQEMGFWEKTKIRLFEKDPSAILDPTIEKIIDQESELGRELFEHDDDVKQIRYFLHNDDWFHEQESALPTKKFTNKYEITETDIWKSSTFFNQQLGSFVTRTVLVDEAESQNLLIASKKYYEKVTGTVYVKAPAPRLRFGSKKK